MSLTPEQRDRLWDLIMGGHLGQASELHQALRGTPLSGAAATFGLPERPICAHTVTFCRLILTAWRLKQAGHTQLWELLFMFAGSGEERNLNRALDHGYYYRLQDRRWRLTLRTDPERQQQWAGTEVRPQELTGRTMALRAYLLQLEESGNGSLGGAMPPQRFRRLIWPLLDNTANVEDWLSRRYLTALRDAGGLEAA